MGGPSEVSPTKRKKVAAALPVAKKPTGDKPGPSRSKLVKSPLTAANSVGNSRPKAAKKNQEAVPEPVEADSEESEQEWVGFGGVNEESDEVDEDNEGDSSEEELLHGLSSDDQDSSDEEIELPGIDISKLPTIAKDDKTVKQKLEKAKRQPVRMGSLATPFFRGLNLGLGVD